MKKGNQDIGNWCDTYLDILEVMHGSLNLHPNQSIEEVCEEWKDNFSTVRLSTSDIGAWGESYLLVLESLYGPLNLQPVLDIEGINQEWINLFMKEYISVAAKRAA